MSVYALGPLGTPPTHPAEASGGVPPAKKFHLTRGDIREWLQILPVPPDCREGALASLEVVDPEDQLLFWELEPKVYLVALLRHLGAYNAIFRFFNYDETTSLPSAKPLTFQSYREGRKRPEAFRTEELFGWCQFEPGKKELTVWAKGRGLGDCGQRAIYRISRDKAVLKEFRAKFNCDGKEWIPGRAPLIFPR